MNAKTAIWQSWNNSNHPVPVQMALCKLEPKGSSNKHISALGQKSCDRWSTCVKPISMWPLTCI